MSLPTEEESLKKLWALLDKHFDTDLLSDEDVEEISSLIQTSNQEAERRGEVSSLKIQKMWAELHGFTGEQLYGGICHAIDSIEQFPDQPLASTILTALTTKAEEGKK